MNILIIGNGFDLHHNLKTTVSNFIEDVKSENSKNFFIIYFKLRLINHSFTWINFENEIAKILINLERMYDEVYIGPNPSNSDIHLVINQKHFSKPDEAFFLKTLGEIGLDYIHYNQLITYINWEFQETWHGLLSERIKKDYIDFVALFNAYIDKINQKVNKNEIKMDISDEIQDIILCADEIINFNYTDTVDYYLNKERENPPLKKPKIKHVHNSVNNNIIIGINELTEHNSEYNSYFYKTINHITKSHEADIHGIQAYIADSLHQCLDIYFIGHSFGESDHYLFNDLKEIFNIEDYQFRESIVKGIRIHYFVYDEDSTKSFVYNMKLFFGSNQVDKLYRDIKIIFHTY